MDDLTNLVEFAEEMVLEKTGDYLSELQRIILVSSLQGDRKTYDQIAEECGYSAKYVKQDVAPKLWQIFTDIFEEKVSKSNIKAVLDRKIRHNVLSVQSVEPLPLSSFSPLPQPKIVGKGNILLVDDRPQNLNLLSELLEEQGYEVRQAINGTMALQTAVLMPPDLILLDIQMPDLDGYTVCQRLKAEPQTHSIPVIFVSALDEAWDKVRGFSVGGVDYISKPFKVIEVLARVENQLKIQQLQRELRVKNRQLEEAMQELSRLATIDPVTQLPNRQSFEQMLTQNWQHSLENATPLTLIFAQVEQFANYCDRYGIADGHHCLYQVAKKMCQVLHPLEKCLFCYDSGIFALVWSNFPENELNHLTHSLTQAMTTLPLLSPITLNLGVKTITPVAEIAPATLILDGVTSAVEP